MAFCERCGRPLNDGEVCNCSPQNTAPQQPAPQQGQPAPQQGQPVPQQGQPYPQQGQPYPQQGQPYPQQGQPMPQQGQPYPQQGQPMPQQGQPYPQQGQPMPQQGQPYPPGYNYPPQEEQPKKKFPVGCIIALVLVIPVAMILAILAAILVPSMLGYVRKSNVSSANSAAKNISNAANSAIVDLDSQGVKLQNGSMILCSQRDANYNEPEYADQLYDKMGAYFADIDKYDYFIVIEDYTCTYVAAQDTQKKVIGCYPSASTTDGPRYYSGGYGDKSDTINDLYEDAYENLPVSYSYDDSYDWDNYDWDDYDWDDYGYDDYDYNYDWN